MLKYVDTKVVFAEIPDQITLAINISNCPCHCEGCHSSHLAENIGQLLDVDAVVDLVMSNRGITCVALMGGDAEPNSINKLAGYLKNEKLWNNKINIKIAWYSGRQELHPDININHFDYIKLGPYIKERGPLNQPTTNQVLYQVVSGSLVDITSLLSYKQYIYF